MAEFTGFDDENIIGLPLAIKKNDKFIVLDWMDAKPCMKHTIDHLSTEDDFVKEIFFYPTERVDGNHLDKKDLITISHLTHEELKSMDVLSLKMPINVEKIKKTYKKLVKIFHPDVNKDNKNAEKLFKEINQAYRILLKKFLKKS